MVPNLQMPFISIYIETLPIRLDIRSNAIRNSNNNSDDDLDNLTETTNYNDGSYENINIDEGINGSSLSIESSILFIYGGNGIWPDTLNKSTTSPSPV